jgi:hypothetical protein
MVGVQLGLLGPFLFSKTKNSKNVTHILTSLFENSKQFYTLLTVCFS